MRKQQCAKLFSATIRDTMKEMGAEKTRPQVIAISAKRAIKKNPGCAKHLARPQERVWLDDDKKHYVVWSSKSFRLYRGQPCVLRVFSLKRGGSSTAWKASLRALLEDRLGVQTRTMPIVGRGDNYVELALDNPKLILAVLNKRVAGFLD